MLNDGSGFKKVYLATGFTDLRKGIDGFAIGLSSFRIHAKTKDKRRTPAAA